MSPQSSSAPAAALLSGEAFPDYAEQLQAFHRAFAAELEALVAAALPVAARRVVDIGCGDGFYVDLLARRMPESGIVVGVDVSPALLSVAQQSLRGPRCPVEFVVGDLERLPFAPSEAFDFAWCAQSLYSFPEPEAALRAIARIVRPRGVVAVLENDTLHQLLLPWPGDVELLLRSAELLEFAAESPRPAKFYVGRRLPSVLAAAGLQPIEYRTQSIDRIGPPTGALRSFLASYLDRLRERTSTRLTASQQQRVHPFLSPADERYLLDSPYFTMTWLNVLAWGRRA